MRDEKDKSNLIINSITLAIFLIELSEYKHKLAIIKANVLSMFLLMQTFKSEKLKQRICQATKYFHKIGQLYAKDIFHALISLVSNILKIKARL